MRKNNIELDKSQMKIWRMRIARWIPKATNTNSQHIILISYPLKQWLHETPKGYVIRALPVFFSSELKRTRELQNIANDTLSAHWALLSVTKT